MLDSHEIYQKYYFLFFSSRHRANITIGHSLSKHIASVIKLIPSSTVDSVPSFVPSVRDKGKLWSLPTRKAERVTSLLID